MQFRLLVDIEVLDLLETFQPARRRRLFAHFRKIQSFPGYYSESVEPDEEGRLLDLSTFEGVSIHYWIDDADRHVKILQIARNE